MTCPKPCGMVYETFASPRLLDPSYHAVKGATRTALPLGVGGFVFVFVQQMMMMMMMMMMVMMMDG